MKSSPQKRRIARSTGPNTLRLGMFAWAALLLVFTFLLPSKSVADEPMPTPMPTAAESSIQDKPKLIWYADPEGLQANLVRVPLNDALRLLAKVTGWKVFVEPDLDRTVSVAFRRLPPHEAVPRILGNLNYALIQRTNASMQLLIFETRSSRATLELADDDRIRNQLIVRLDPNSSMTAEELAASLGAELKGSIDALNAHLLEFPDDAKATAARDQLSGMDGIAQVEDNFSTLPPEMAEALGIIQQSSIRLKPATFDGNRLIIGLIDTGVQSINPAYDAFLVNRISLGGNPADSTTLAHGTSMYANLVKAAEVALGAGAEANFGVVSVDVYGQNSLSTSFDVARGIVEAVGAGATLINASLGSNSSSPILHDVIRRYEDQGVLFIAAAGNQPVTSPTYPSGYPEVLAVSAGNSDGVFASYANRSSVVDLLLPGTGTVPYAGDLYRVSGTSVSAARASGIAAALWTQNTVTVPTELGPILRVNFGAPPAP